MTEITAQVKLEIMKGLIKVSLECPPVKKGQ